MSYDIDFRVKVEGVDKWISVGDCTANITWNVRKIIELAIEKGLNELQNNGLKYKKYESPNGWGTVGGTMYFFETILKEWKYFKYEEPELAEFATFWID